MKINVSVIPPTGDELKELVGVVMKENTRNPGESGADYRERLVEAINEPYTAKIEDEIADFFASKDWCDDFEVWFGDTGLAIVREEREVREEIAKLAGIEEEEEEEDGEAEFKAVWGRVYGQVDEAERSLRNASNWLGCARKRDERMQTALDESIKATANAMRIVEQVEQAMQPFEDKGTQTKIANLRQQAMAIVEEASAIAKKEQGEAKAV